MDLQARLGEIERSFRAGERLEAVERARQLLTEHPEVNEVKILLAKLLGAGGDLSGAVLTLNRVVVSDPKAWEAWDLLGAYQRALGDVPAATRSSLEASRLNSSLASPPFNLGLCAAQEGRTREALNHFRRASELDPNSWMIWRQCALSAAQLGAADEAQAAFLQAIELAPQNAELRMEFGSLLVSMGANDEAAASIDAAVERATEYEVALQFGNWSFQNGFGSSAEKAFRKAVAIDPSGGAAWERLGAVLQSKGRFGEAEPILVNASQLLPKSGDSLYRLISGRRIRPEDHGWVDDAKSRLELADLDPAQREILLYGLGKSCDDLRMFGDAIHYFDAANQIAKSRHLETMDYDVDNLKMYFDQIKKTFTVEFFRRNCFLGSSSAQPVFVVGMLRSGTTLTEQILSMHPSVGAGGEVEFWQSRSTNATMAKAASGGLSASESSALARSYLAELRKKGGDHPRVVDKYPNNYTVLGLIHLVFPQAKIIHCRRNAVDNCLSIYMTPFTSPPMFAYDRGNMVTAYRMYMDLMAHWRTVLPGDLFLEVNYEDLVGDAEATAGRMLQFLGLDWDPDVLRHEANERLVVTPSFWQVRQPIFLTSVERWRNYEPWLGELSALL